MPLTTNLILPLERARHHPDAESLEARANEDDDQLQYHHRRHGKAKDILTDVSMLNRLHSDPGVPAVPPRSSKRASRLFGNLMLQLQPQEKIPSKDVVDEPPVESDPHAAYLSSEEEMSVSADEYDDSLIDLYSERASSRASSRDSYEDIARVVSFLFVGRPQLIDVSRSRPSALRRRSTDLSLRSRRRPSPLRLESKDSRASTPSSLRSEIRAPSTTHPLRQLKNPAAIHSNVSLVASLSSRHSFLQSDPYPAASTQDVQLSPQLRETRPKTPTALASAALKGGLRGVSRTLSLSRNKPSMPKLNVAFTSVTMLDGGSSPNPSITTSVATSVSTASPSTPRERVDQGPIYYSDIMRNAIKAPPPPTPPEEFRLTGRFLFGISKRKTFRAG